MSTSMQTESNDESHPIESELASSSHPVHIINPTNHLIREVAGLVDDHSPDDLPQIHIRATDETLRETRREFGTATRLEDLREAGKLTITSDDSVGPNTFFISKHSVTVPVIVNEEFATVAEADDDVASEIFSEYRAGFDPEEEDEFTLRDPPRSEMMATFEDAFDEDVADDLRALFNAVEDDPDVHPTEIKQVPVIVLVGAKNELALKKLSDWSEYNDVASKASVSRVKTTLDEKGYLDGEKIPQDIGRPGIRLLLAESVSPDIDSLATIAADEMG